MDIPKSWTFKTQAVAADFNNHVVEQLPWYPMITDLVCHIAASYLPNDGKLIDLGASTGSITAHLKQTINDRHINAISVDNSEAMRGHFRGVGRYIVANVVTAIDDCELKNYDVAVLMLLVMFIPYRHRATFLRRLIHNGNRGGAVVVVDKITPSDGYLGQVITKMTLKNKIESGVDANEIIKKELSLTGIQRPSDDDLYTSNGFKRWFQVGDFSGYVLEL